MTKAKSDWTPLDRIVSLRVISEHVNAARKAAIKADETSYAEVCQTMLDDIHQDIVIWYAEDQRIKDAYAKRYPQYQKS